MTFLTIFNEIHQLYFFNKTPLYVAIDKGNNELVKLYLANQKIDVNTKLIQTNPFFLNAIQILIF